MSEINLSEALATALRAAEKARELIMSYYSGSFDIEIKADQTPVTVADRGAEQVIRDTISSAYPEHGIYGEEYGAQGKDAEFLWLVDPIDGTTLTSLGRNNAISVIAIAERGTMFDPGPCVYMDKIAVGPEAADVIDIDAEYERLRNNGMTFHGPPPTSEELGSNHIRAIYARDPDGNIVELQEVIDPGVPFHLDHAPLVNTTTSSTTSSSGDSR